MFAHPSALSRRTVLQAGSIGLLGLGLSELNELRATSATLPKGQKSVIFIFLSGGLAQHESFDMKPDAPEDIRGEFRPIATQTPGLRICEHLPKLAARSDRWSLVRSLTHRSNDHSASHHIMLTGRSDLPIGFNPNAPKPTDHPSLAALATALCPPRNNLPPAIVLPDRIVHNSGRVLPGQFAGALGNARNPWFLEMSAFEPRAYGAFPTYEFDHQQRKYEPKRSDFSTPNLSLPEGVTAGRFADRTNILQRLDQQRSQLEAEAETRTFSQSRQNAIDLLVHQRVRKAFDWKQASSNELDRYGRNSFGWSLLTAARLVEAGVQLVQVNLGNNESWDTHGNAFPHLKDKLLPPTDQAVSALLDDLELRGLLEDTLIVMAGEFGRTPRITTLTKHYKGPGRDHWGAVQSVWFAGGGVPGGHVIGSSDKLGAYPATEPQTPENFAATIFTALGLPKTVAWHDAENRPHFLYHGQPIRGLL